MFSNLRRLIGNIKVTENRDIIYIDGLPANVIAKDIYKQWSTSRIADYMFNTMSHSSMSFHKFFAPDIVYTLETLCKERSARHNVRAIRHVVDLIYENTWMGTTLLDYPDILDFSKLKNINTELFPHQLEFLQFYNKAVPKFDLKGMCLGAAPGTGKTLTGIALAETLNADVVICIVPKNSVDRVWGASLNTFLKHNPKYWLSTSNTPIAKDAKYYVFHYEQLENAIEFFKGKTFKMPVIDLDESHNFNEMTSLRTQNFITLCNMLNCKHVIWSSGTLVKAIGNEVIPVLHTLDSYFTPKVEERFKKIFGKNSARASDILRNRLGLMMFQVVKKDIVKNEVNTMEKRITIPNGHNYTLESVRAVMASFIKQQMAFYESNMKSYIALYTKCIDLHSDSLRSKSEKEALAQYKDYVKLIRANYDPIMMKQEVMFCNKYELKVIIPSLPASLKDEFKNVRSIVKYYQLKVQGEALGRILGKLRTQCNIDIVRNSHIEDEIDSALKKTVIFTSFVDVVDEADTYLKELGYSPLKVYGSTNKDLVNIINIFDKDIDANPLIATFQSLSTAVPLVMASTAILMNSPFRDYEYQQSVSRIDRIGQDSVVSVYNVLLDTGTDSNISTRSNDIMTWSKEQVNAILGLTNTNDPVVSMENLMEFIEGDVSSLNNALATKPSWTSW